MIVGLLDDAPRRGAGSDARDGEGRGQGRQDAGSEEAGETHGETFSIVGVDA